MIIFKSKDFKILFFNCFLVYFTNYLKRGYYPFVLEDDFDVRLQQIINHTLESEIAAILSASRNNIEDYSLYIEEAG